MLRILVLMLLSLSGCGLVKDTEAMRKTTEALENKTGELLEITARMERQTAELASLTRAMRDTMDGLSGTTDAMSSRMAILLREQREGLALQIRKDAVELLIAKDRPMELRLRDAAVFEQSFEFQLWENILEDDEYKRQNLLAVGAEEFMITLKGMIDGKRHEPDPLLADSKMESLLALSAMVDQMNLLQIAASERSGHGFEPVSILDLVEQALLAKRGIDNGTAASGQTAGSGRFINKVLMYEDEAHYLLQLRMHILPAIVVSKISDVDNAGLCEKLRLIFAALKIGKSWTADFSKMNAAEIRELTKYLRDAISVRNFLVKFGDKPKFESKLGSVLTRAVLKDDPHAGRGKIQATEEFKAAWHELTDEI